MVAGVGAQTSGEERQEEGPPRWDRTGRLEDQQGTVARPRWQEEQSLTLMRRAATTRRASTHEHTQDCRTTRCALSLPRNFGQRPQILCDRIEPAF